jgi:hypothetical protein
VFHLPIFEVAKTRCGARITGHEDYGVDRYLRRKELLSGYDGTDGVGAKVVVKVCKGATPCWVSNWELLAVEHRKAYISVARYSVSSVNAL